jgi:hypothetical protein
MQLASTDEIFLSDQLSKNFDGHVTTDTYRKEARQEHEFMIEQSYHHRLN